MFIRSNILCRDLTDEQITYIESFVNKKVECIRDFVIYDYSGMGTPFCEKNEFVTITNVNTKISYTPIQVTLENKEGMEKRNMDAHTYFTYFHFKTIVDIRKEKIKSLLK